MITKCKRLKDSLFILFWVIFIMVFAYWFVKQANHQTEIVDSIQVIKNQTKITVNENQSLLKEIKRIEDNQNKILEDMRQAQTRQSEIMEEIHSHAKRTAELLDQKHPEGQ